MLKRQPKVNICHYASAHPYKKRLWVLLECLPSKPTELSFVGFEGGLRALSDKRGKPPAGSAMGGPSARRQPPVVATPLQISTGEKPVFHLCKFSLFIPLYSPNEPVHQSEPQCLHAIRAAPALAHCLL